MITTMKKCSSFSIFWLYVFNKILERRRQKLQDLLTVITIEHVDSNKISLNKLRKLIIFQLLIWTLPFDLKFLKYQRQKINSAKFFLFSIEFETLDDIMMTNSSFSFRLSTVITEKNHWLKTVETFWN